MHKIYHILFLLCGIIVLFSSINGAQIGYPLEQNELLNIFIDCRWCDIDYIRTEVNFVNYVIDRTDADVHVLITSQRTGGGGRA